MRRLAWGSIFAAVDDATVTSVRAELANMPDEARASAVADAEKYLEAQHQKACRDQFPDLKDPALLRALAIAGASENDQ